MKLIFTGDLSASGFVFEKMENDDSRLLDNLAVHFSKADYVHVNLENPITSCPFRDDKKGARLRASTKLASYLKRVGIKICCIANNHIMDCGELGLVETDKLLSKQGVISYGTNLTKTYIILQNGKTKVVLVALSQCEGPVASVKKRGPYAFKRSFLKSILKEIKRSERPDVIILNYHGGTEYNIIPEPQRRRLFHSIIDLGVDVIIGHHAHVPQGYEKYSNGHIFYGLGNFLFDIPSHRKYPFTNSSYFVVLNIDGKLINFERISYVLDRSAQDIKLQTNIIPRLGDLDHFQTEASYHRAWINDAKRVYSLRQRIWISDKKTLLNILKRCLYLMAIMIRDLFHIGKRPFVFGFISSHLHK